MRICICVHKRYTHMCIILQHIATRCNRLRDIAPHRHTLQHGKTNCNTLQHTKYTHTCVLYIETHCNMVKQTATHCSTQDIHTHVYYTSLHHMCIIHPSLDHESRSAIRNIHIHWRILCVWIICAGILCTCEYIRVCSHIHDMIHVWFICVCIYCMCESSACEYYVCVNVYVCVVTYAITLQHDIHSNIIWGAYD